MTKRNPVQLLMVIPLIILITISCSKATIASQPIEYDDTELPAPESGLTCPELMLSNVPLSIGPLEESYRENYSDKLLDYLNLGGSIDGLRAELRNIMDWFTVEEKDITNDSNPEIIVEANWIYIIGCRGGAYQSILIIEPHDLVYDYSPIIRTNDDINNNNIPELIIAKQTGGPSPINIIEILEWDGKIFRNIVTNDQFCISHGMDTCIREGKIILEDGYIEYTRIEDGTKEINIISGMKMGKDPDKYGDVTPIKINLRWNGDIFVIYKIDML